MSACLNHQGIGDKLCPKCRQNKSVHWHSIGTWIDAKKVFEVGRFYCEKCGWSSPLHQIKIRSVTLQKVEKE